MNIIAVEKRNTQVKGKQLRKEGIVPCCVYGGNLPASIAIQMEEKTADKLLRTLRLGSKVKLNLEGETITTQIKDKTRCFADNKIEHIGFQALSPKQKVNSVAHVLLKNDENVPGVLEKMMLEIPYASLPKDMIDTVTVDLDGKKIGTVLTVADIPEFLSEHIELQVEPDAMVLRITEKKHASAKEEAEQ